MTNATIVFDDHPHQKKHVISQLDLLVPFTSSFLHLRKEFTQPKFSAVINGDPVNLTGRTLPFDENHAHRVQGWARSNVDLRQYWSYLPIDTPLLLQEGRFTSEISLFFERPDAQRLNLFLGGGGRLTGLKLADKQDGTVLSLQELAFHMEKYSLGDNELVLKDLTLNHPYFKVIRRANNDINWAGYFPETNANSTKSKTPGDKDTSLILNIQKLDIADGELDWQDPGCAGRFPTHLPQHASDRHRDRHPGQEALLLHGFGREKGNYHAQWQHHAGPPLEGTATLGGTGFATGRLQSLFQPRPPPASGFGYIGLLHPPWPLARTADTMTASVHDGSLSLTQPRPAPTKGKNAEPDPGEAGRIRHGSRPEGKGDHRGARSG